MLSQEVYQKNLMKLESYYKTLSSKELDEMEHLMDDTVGDRVSFDGVDIFKEDVIRIINAVRSGSEI